MIKDSVVILEYMNEEQYAGFLRINADLSGQILKAYQEIAKTNERLNATNIRLDESYKQLESTMNQNFRDVYEILIDMSQAISDKGLVKSIKSKQAKLGHASAS